MHVSNLSLRSKVQASFPEKNRHNIHRVSQSDAISLFPGREMIISTNALGHDLKSMQIEKATEKHHKHNSTATEIVTEGILKSDPNERSNQEFNSGETNEYNKTFWQKNRPRKILAISILFFIIFGIQVSAI